MYFELQGVCISLILVELKGLFDHLVVQLGRLLCYSLGVWVYETKEFVSSAADNLSQLKSALNRHEFRVNDVFFVFDPHQLRFEGSQELIVELPI